MEILNTWQFYLFLYYISAVLFLQYYKLAVRNVKKDGVATVLLQILSSITLLFLIPLFPIKFPAEIKFYILIIVASIFYAINDRFQTTSRKHLDVSVIAILGQLKAVLMFIGGLVVFREPFIIGKVLGALLIIGANILIFYQKGSFKINKYVAVNVIASFAFAIALTIDVGISSNFNLPLYIVITLIIPALIISLVEKIKIKEIVQELKSKERNYYLITGIAWAVAVFASIRSMQLGPITVIIPLQAITVLLNVIVAYFIHQEKQHFARKIIAAVLIIIGIIVLT